MIVVAVVSRGECVAGCRYFCVNKKRHSNKGKKRKKCGKQKTCGVVPLYESRKLFRYRSLKDDSRILQVFFIYLKRLNVCSIQYF